MNSESGALNYPASIPCRYGAIGLRTQSPAIGGAGLGSFPIVARRETPACSGLWSEVMAAKRCHAVGWKGRVGLRDVRLLNPSTQDLCSPSCLSCPAYRESVDRRRQQPKCELHTLSLRALAGLAVPLISTKLINQEIVMSNATQTLTTPLTWTRESPELERDGTEIE